MSDKKLESFKIGDTQQPGVSKAKAPSGPDRQAEHDKNTLGFSRIEAILEDDETGAVSESLNHLLNQLEAFGSRAKTNKDKAAAQKAIVAVERTADLLDYLFQTKAQMAGQD